MPALKEFANFITLNTADLADTYAQLLEENGGGYETISKHRRVSSARKLLKPVTESYESETSEPLARLFDPQVADDIVRWSADIHPPQPILEVECLGQTLAPVVTNLESGKFLWQLLSEVRVIASQSTRVTPVAAAAEKPQAVPATSPLSPPPEAKPKRSPLDTAPLVEKREEDEKSAPLAAPETTPAHLLISVDEAVMLLDEEGFIDCNEATLKIFGYASKDQFIHTHPSQQSPPQQPDGQDSLTAANERIATAYRQGSNRFEWLHCRADGTPFPAEVILTRVELDGKQILQAIVRDITRYKEAEQAVQESERWLKTIMDSVQAGIVIIDAETREIVDANPAALGKIGTERDNVLGSICHKFICPAEKGRCPVCDLGQTVDNSERVLLTAQGEVIPIIKNVVTVTLDNREYLIESFVDITEQKQAEQTVKESEEKYKALVDGMGDTVMVINFDGKFVDMNSAAIEVLGYSREELLSMGPVDIDSKLDEDTIKNLIKTLPSDRIQVFETAHTTKSGKLIPVEIHSSIVKYQGKDAILSIGRDITERKLAEEENLKFKLGIERSHDAFFMTDVDGTIVFANAAFEEVYGYTPEEAMGNTPRIIKSGMLPNEQYKYFWDTLLSGQTVAGELINKTKDGQLITVAASNNPILDEAGEIVGFLAIHRDVSDRVASEQTLAKRARELETVAEVGTIISTIFDVQELLQTVVDLIKERFDLYHAHVYLLNSLGDALNLIAGAGEVGQQMVREGWQIPLHKEQSLVARAARTEMGFMVDNVQEEPGWLPNPNLPETRSELAVPLVLGGQVLGVIDVQADEVGHFQDEDLHIQTILAAQVAVAIQNAEQYEKTNAALAESEILAREQTVLYELGQALTARLNVDQVLEEAYRQASRLIDTSNFYIAMYDPDKEAITFPFFVSDSEIDREIKVISVTEGIAGYIVRNKTSLLFEDNVRARQEAIGITLVGEEAQSWLGVPLMVGDRVLGVISVQSFTSPGLFDEHSRELLSAIGSQVAIALQNATLFENIIQAQVEAEERLKETQILQKFTQALSATMEVNGVIDAFFEASMALIGADYAIFSLVDKVQQRVRAVSGYNISEDHLQRANHPLESDDIMVDIVRTGKTELITGWDERFDIDNYTFEEMEEWGLRIFTPITIRRENIGLVEVGFKEKVETTVQETQVKLLRTLIDQTAIALESVQRYEASQKAARREQTIREITDKLRAAPNIEKLVTIATQELGERFGATYTKLELGLEKKVEADNNGHNGQ